MKKEKNSKKGKENLVGKIIYSFLLFAPLLSILATCVYTIINENAKDSYYGKTINEELTEYATNKLDINIEYTTMTNDAIITDQTIQIVALKQTNANDVNAVKDNVFAIRFYKTSAEHPNCNIDFQYMNGNAIQHIYKTYISNQGATNENITQYTMQYQVDGTQQITGNLGQFTTYKTYNKFSYMDNVFEYSIYKVENNDLYNWSKTTGTYTVVQNTAQLLGITNTFIPMLLTYWLIISIIYIIYDIGLIMIWIAHNKVHELVESV